jgi:gas vesicle protein
MSQRDGFTGGFITGAIVGGIVGGIIGATLANRRTQEVDEFSSPLSPGKHLNFEDEENIERARRSLEAKIAQLNLVIDDVRQQLSAVNGSTPDKE